MVFETIVKEIVDGLLLGFPRLYSCITEINKNRALFSPRLRDFALQVRVLYKHLKKDIFAKIMVIFDSELFLLLWRPCKYLKAMMMRCAFLISANDSVTLCQSLFSDYLSFSS